MSPIPASEALEALAKRVRYIGSPEHKRHPSFAGPPAPKNTSTLCDPRFANQQDLLTHWLQEAIRRGMIGKKWDGDFPRNVWLRQDGVVYEARLVNQVSGEYKGWPLEDFEIPEDLR
jgi:hypothetical protein